MTERRSALVNSDNFLAAQNHGTALPLSTEKD